MLITMSIIYTSMVWEVSICTGGILESYFQGNALE